MKEALSNISFTHRYWALLLPLIMIGADILTGWIQASINGTWDSTKMRKGLFRKSAEIVVIGLAYVVQAAVSMPADIFIFIALYVVVMELLSVIENLDQAGLPVPTWITRRLAKAAQVMTEDDPLQKDEDKK